MAWGVRPKYEIKQQFDNADLNVLQDKIVSVFLENKLEITDDSLYIIQAEKKYRMNFMTFFYLSKPIVYIDAIVSKHGLLTLKSRYDYTSPYATPINDSGKQKKLLEKLMSAITN